jgi:hypothetical protein|tara:strand:- start:18448 stop:19314 length:867 start_codon:yes stop_codon:yes gene_type:complete
MDNLNVLVEAKREYLEQLSILICPVMIDVFDAMYQEAHKLSKGRQTLIMFQKLLKDVPEWNETMAKQHTDNIADRCSWFRDLVAAVFVSSVKILSAVRLSKDSKKMSVKLPTNEIFIHTCYKNAAKDLYRDPYIFSETQSEHARNDKLYDRFSTCVESSVKELIPVQQILQTYMTAETDEYVDGEEPDLHDEDVGEFDENEDQQYMGDEQMGDGMEEGMEEGMENEQYQEQGMEGNPYPDDTPQQPPNPFQNEFKTIRSTPEEQTQAPDDREELFSDAADSRSKKLGY